MPTDLVKLYHDALLRTLTADPRVRGFTAPGQSFWYRPGQLLVALRDLSRVEERLRQRGISFTRGQGFGGVARLLLSLDANIPAIVSDLRDVRQWPLPARVPAVQPHHVTLGFGNIMGSPHGPPDAADALSAPDPARAKDGAGVLVGICDTGIWSKAASRHPLWLGGAYVPQADDIDELYSTGSVLAWQGGHGTFVAGVLRQAAPGVAFDPEPALDANGIGDEEMLVNALAAVDAKAQLINLSLGCFTQDNLAPMPLANAIAARGPEVVVVAAAGNAGTNRPSWPAALDKVVAVGAVTVTSNGVVPADYANYGPWVDASADGDRVSTYVDGSFEVPGAPAEALNGFARWVGTSFAAPYVAGWLATQMTTQNISAAQARAQLLAAPTWHPDYGVLVA